MPKKVMIGMSGGVDSSVAALLLKKQGYEVVGVTMKLRKDKYMSESNAYGCCSLDDIEDARRVCYKLGIDHLVLNFTDLFQKKVIDYFVSEYESARTPNPCIACNRYLKFDAFLNKAKQLNFDYIATGHYSIIEYNTDVNRWLLRKSKSSKDQSYVLYNMTQDQLAHTLMPLANFEKSYVRELAKENNLPVALKPDSQEICFVENNDYAAFIEEYTGKKSKKGNFIDEHGNILGQHNGIMKYTIGQRKGIGLSLGEPMYVTQINPVDNTITLGKEGSQYSSSFEAADLNFIAFDKLKTDIKADVKIRYNANPSSARIIPISENRVKIEFDKPQRSITKGQACVFYDGDVVLGGGTID